MVTGVGDDDSGRWCPHDGQNGGNTAAMERTLVRLLAILTVLAVFAVGCAIDRLELDVGDALSDAATAASENASGSTVPTAEPTVDSETDAGADERADDTGSDTGDRDADADAGDTDSDEAAEGADNNSDSGADTDPVPSTGLVGEPGIGDEYYPQLGNSGYDVSHYDISFEFDNETRAIDGVTTLDITPTAELASFNLDLVGFDVASVRIDGADASFSRSGQELTIWSSDPLPADELMKVEVTYAGVPTSITSPAFPTNGWNDLGRLVFVAGEPEGAAGWFPSNDHPLDKATYRIAVSVSGRMKVASNGELIASNTIGERADGDLVEWVFESDDPQASYLTTLAIGDLSYYEEDDVDGITVRHVAETSVVDDAAEMNRNTSAMMETFIELFGPYPFDEYGTLVIDESIGFALETQTLSVFGNDFLDTDADFVVAHELAHQWFGNHVSLSEWQDLWLNEGFASYAEHLWLSARDANYDTDRVIRQTHRGLAATGLLDQPPGIPPTDELFHISVYIRGSFLLHALRLTIGDEQFFDLLRAWVIEFGGANATTEDFIAMAEEVSGEDLADFFDEWLYAPTLPELPEAEE